MEYWNDGAMEEGDGCTGQGARQIQRKKRNVTNHENTKVRKHEGKSANRWR